MMRWALLWWWCLACSAAAQEREARHVVEQANVAFADGDYATALEGYRQAEVTLPESPELAFNRAVAHYKLGEFNEARDHFNRALATRDLALESKVKFNLGNVAYASALEKMSSIQEAIDLLKAAMGRYRDALELAPGDDDARANIEMAQLLIKDLLDKLKQQQEQQSQDQDSQDQQQDQSQDQQQQGDSQQQQGDDQQQDQGDSQEQRDQPQDGEPDQQPTDEDQQAGDGQEQEVREMSREEAQRLLQSVRDRERQRREEKARRFRSRWVPVLKDW